MNNKANDIITFPLLNKWTIIITLIFMLAKYMNIIDWSAIWIFSPLWIPLSIALLLMIILYILKITAKIIYIFYKKIQ